MKGGTGLYIKKWLVLTALSLLLFVKPAMAYDAITLRFAGQPVSPEIQAINRDSSVFINLPFLNKYLNIVTAWDISASDLFFKFGKTSVKMYAGNRGYYIDGKSQSPLDQAPFEQDGQFWLPLQFLLRMGLTVTSLSENQLSLDWDRKYLLGVESTTYQGQPALMLIGSKELEIRDSLSQESNQLVLALPNTTAHFTLDIRNKTNYYIKQLRLEEVPEELRLVLDLNQTSGYRLLPVPGQPNRVMLVFNYLVNQVSLVQQGGETKVAIETSFPAIYRIQPATKPHHLVLDLEGATLAQGIGSLPGDHRWIRSIIARQLDPAIVRLEIVFVKAIDCHVIRVPETPDRIEISTTQKLTGIKWEETGSGGELTLTATGAIAANFDQKDNGTPQELQLDLENLRPAPGVQLPTIRSEFISAIHWVVQDSVPARIGIRLDRFVTYHPEFSADRKTLVIQFHHSPLVGKTIVLDAGHGGNDNGACGRQGTREKDNNLEIVMRLKDLLEASGAKVVLTRTGDYFVSLYERSFLANFVQADLFISVHTNNQPDLNVRGMEVYRYRTRTAAQSLAENILRRMAQTTGLKPVKVMQESFIVIRESEMPGVLVETGYLSNFEEENIIRTPVFRAAAARGIYQGIMDYYGG